MARIMRLAVRLGTGAIFVLACLSAFDVRAERNHENSALNAWNPPYTLGNAGIKPAVAIDSQNRIHYAWWDINTKVIRYTFCTALTADSCAPVETLPNNGQDSFYPSIAIDPQDRPHVVWESKDAGSYSVFWSRRENGQWTAIKKISREPYSELPDIDIGLQGIIHVTYQSKQNNTGYVYYVTSNDGFTSLRSVRLAEELSDRPLDVAAEMLPEEGVTGQQLANGLYPRVAADADDRAHVVWNAPSPYGIYYAVQQPSGDFGAKITVSTGHKDQTPDIAIAPNGTAVIVWGAYDNFNVALAEFHQGTLEFRKYDVDGGIAQSLWPRAAVDCSGTFHFVFQGKVTSDESWHIYHRTYDANSNGFAKRKTIADTGAQEQTPVIAATDIAAVIYINTTQAVANGSTNALGITCGSGTTPTPTPTTPSTLTVTPTFTATPPLTTTVTPTTTAATATPTTTDTPSPTATPTATATSVKEHIPNNDSRIVYRGKWSKANHAQASDGNYRICAGQCKKGTAAQIWVRGSAVEWETAYARTYGLARVVLDGQAIEVVDLCQGNKKSNKPKFAVRSYPIPNDGLLHLFEITALGNTECGSEYVVVDGFNIVP